MACRVTECQAGMECPAMGFLDLEWQVMACRDPAFRVMACLRECQATGCQEACQPTGPLALAWRVTECLVTECPPATCLHSTCLHRPMEVRRMATLITRTELSGPRAVMRDASVHRRTTTIPPAASLSRREIPTTITLAPAFIETRCTATTASPTTTIVLRGTTLELPSTIATPTSPGNVLVHKALSARFFLLANS